MYYCLDETLGTIKNTEIFWKMLFQGTNENFAGFNFAIKLVTKDFEELNFAVCGQNREN